MLLCISKFYRTYNSIETRSLQAKYAIIKEKRKEVISIPYVNIKITKEGNVTPEQKRALIEGATNLLHDVLGKNKSPTVVTIEVYTDYWGIGGVPVTEIRKNAAAKK